MNSNAPRAGDKALYINPDSSLRGRVVLVTSDPYWGATRSANGKCFEGFISRVDHPDGIAAPWSTWRAPTKYLIRVPPDDEADGLFDEEQAVETVGA